MKLSKQVTDDSEMATYSDISEAELELELVELELELSLILCINCFNCSLFSVRKVEVNVILTRRRCSEDLGPFVIYTVSDELCDVSKEKVLSTLVNSRRPLSVYIWKAKIICNTS